MKPESHDVTGCEIAAAAGPAATKPKCDTLTANQDTRPEGPSQTPKLTGQPMRKRADPHPAAPKPKKTAKPKAARRNKIGGGWRGWHIDITPDFKPGDPCPDGYIARSEWAEVQMKAGLRQVVCGMCSRWQFPQELVPDLVIETHGMTSRGKPVVHTAACCLECEKAGRRFVERIATQRRATAITDSTTSGAVEPSPKLPDEGRLTGCPSPVDRQKD